MSFNSDTENIDYTQSLSISRINYLLGSNGKPKYDNEHELDYLRLKLELACHLVRTKDNKKPARGRPTKQANNRAQAIKKKHGWRYRLATRMTTIENVEQARKRDPTLVEVWPEEEYRQDLRTFAYMD